MTGDAMRDVIGMIGEAARESRRRGDQDVEDIGAHILSAITAAGYAVVLVEPTNEMIRGALACDRPPSGPTLYHNIYRAMIAAARWPREARMTDAPTD